MADHLPTIYTAWGKPEREGEREREDERVHGDEQKGPAKRGDGESGETGPSEAEGSALRGWFESQSDGAL
jgi:hypothetical protein